MSDFQTAEDASARLAHDKLRDWDWERFAMERVRRRRLTSNMFFLAYVVGGTASSMAAAIVLLVRDHAGLLAALIVNNSALALLWAVGLYLRGAFLQSPFEANRLTRSAFGNAMQAVGFETSWQDFERRTRMAAARTSGVDAEDIPLALVARTLADSGLWGDDALNEFRYVLSLRNQLVHGQRSAGLEELSLASAYMADLVGRLSMPPRHAQFA